HLRFAQNAAVSLIVRLGMRDGSVERSIRSVKVIVGGSVSQVFDACLAGFAVGIVLDGPDARTGGRELDAIAQASTEAEISVDWSLGTENAKSGEQTQPDQPSTY